MYSDPIADMLTRIRNAFMARKEHLSMPFSQIKFEIAKIFEKRGYLKSVNVTGEGVSKELVIEIAELVNPALRPTFKRISTPGSRVYTKAKDIKKVNNGFGIGVLSTPKGLMTSYEAYAQGLGGEYICQVY